LLGGVLPGYQTTAGEELSERTLATAAGHVEDATPAVDGRVDATTTVDLPATIRNEQYTLELSNATLALDHPEPSVEREIRLALGPNVTTVRSRWRSGGRLEIRVGGPLGNRTVSIGDPA
jgi:hypothetical protein